MSYSEDFHILVMLLCYFIFFHGFPVLGRTNPFVQSSTREELVLVAGYGEEKLSTVLVVGSIHCDACLAVHGEAHQIHAWPVKGARVGVKCNTGAKSKSVVARGITDEFGDFIIDIPSNLHGIPNIEKICSVRVLRIPKNSSCRLAYARRHKGMSLSSFGNGIRTYSAGDIAVLHSTSKALQTFMTKKVDQIQKNVW